MPPQFETNGTAASDETEFDRLWQLRYALSMNIPDEIERLSYLLPVLKIGSVPTRQAVEIGPVQELLF